MIAISIMLSLASCKKLIAIDPPVDKIVAAEVFSDDATATSAMLGLYSRMGSLNGALSNSGPAQFTGMSADETYRLNPVVPEYDEFRINNISSGNSNLVTPMWSNAYNIIFQANSILYGLKDNAAITSSLKLQLEGEAQFIRAYMYFYLCNLFGPVPIVTSINYQENAVLPRSETQLVYSQIISDLKEAQLKLAAQYPTSGRVRANKLAATALLARVYLYKKQWAQAEVQATAIINSGAYSLVQDMNKVFLANSQEAILQLLPVAPITATTVNTFDGLNYIPNGNVLPSFALTNNLLSAFSADDKRKLNWIKSITISGNTYSYPYKYQVYRASAITEYYMFFRLAEQYLIRAEALAEQNKLSDAIADLDMIRSRAGIPLIRENNPAISQTDLLNEIFKERQRELFMEGGHRWFDLKRTDRANTILGLAKPNWKPSAQLYPIPFNEILRNPALEQNPGYN